MKHPIKFNAPWVDCQDPAAAQKLEQFLTLTPATLLSRRSPVRIRTLTPVWPLLESPHTGMSDVP